MFSKFLSKFALPTFHLNHSSSTLVETVYPAPPLPSRTIRFSMISTDASESEVNSWSPVDEAPTPTEIKEIIPLLSINAEHETHRVAFKTLQQCIDLLRTLPSDEIYTRESKFVPKSTIGKHVRHVYDHFRLLFEKIPHVSDGTDSAYSSVSSEKLNVDWQVDYDNRLRNVQLELSRAVAINRMKEIQQAMINEYVNIPLDTTVRLQATIDSSMQQEPVGLLTTYGRELWFCCHHAIHHYALIRVICTELNIHVPDDFGIAPSTLKSRMKQYSE
ncbi:1112_t:CDS:2 [Paraglomus occultum]|uniref:1112_t:CDS:1 n=1 Tax=Paraglomus occultum TaxID=144539 RepID=A0A9N8ZGD2_9GLOM|nr:1112_t:CDS:2 [Paraglomus occultum]